MYNAWQKMINHLYRYPRSNWQTVKRFGGWNRYRQLRSGQRKMQVAARRIGPIPSAAAGFPLYFLTGQKFLYQTLFCIRSLVKVTSIPFHFILVDDGTFDPQLTAEINRQLPGAEIVSSDQISKNLDRMLPAANFPHIRAKRAIYPHLKKLTDIHTLGGDAWKLVLDSDMLFWNEPVELLHWLRAPALPIFLKDCQQSYGYPLALMEQLAGSRVPELLNVGLIGLNSRTIAWQQMENWIRCLDEQAGPSYYLEQALTAMIIGHQPALQLSELNYIVQPASTQTGPGNVILHHYVDLSKADYFRKMWKMVI